MRHLRSFFVGVLIGAAIAAGSIGIAYASIGQPVSRSHDSRVAYINWRHQCFEHWRFTVWRHTLYVDWRERESSASSVTGVWWTHYGLWRLPSFAQSEFACVRNVESHNTTPDMSSANAQGLYQFMPGTWQPYGKVVFGGLPPTPNQATRAQQDSVAAWYWLRNGHLAPEWQDGCGP